MVIIWLIALILRPVSETLMKLGFATLPVIEVWPTYNLLRSGGPIIFLRGGVGIFTGVSKHNLVIAQILTPFLLCGCAFVRAEKGHDFDPGSKSKFHYNKPTENSLLLNGTFHSMPVLARYDKAKWG